MNLLQLNYDLDLSAYPGQVVRFHEPSLLSGIYLWSEGPHLDKIWPKQLRKCLTRRAYPLENFEPVLPDDPANIYPGDKVMCIKGTAFDCDVGDTAVVNDDLLAVLDRTGIGFNLWQGHWAILEPATTPRNKIEEGDEVVCRASMYPKYVGLSGKVITHLETLACTNVGGPVALDFGNCKWLVTKKAEKSGTLTQAMFDRLIKVEGLVSQFDVETWCGRVGEPIHPVLLGAIWNACIERGWLINEEVGRIAEVNGPVVSTFALHHNRRTRIVLAFLDANGV